MPKQKEKPKVKPVHEIQTRPAGGRDLAERNRFENGGTIRHNVTFSRLYKPEGEQWHNSIELRPRRPLASGEARGPGSLLDLRTHPGAKRLAPRGAQRCFRRRKNRISKGFRGQFFAPPASTFHPLPPTRSGGAVHTLGPSREVPMVQKVFC